MEYVIPALVQGIFTLAHITSKWQDHRVNVESVGFFTYVKERAPAKTILSVLTSVGLAFVLIDKGIYLVESAFLAGWSSNSLMDHLTKRGQQILA